MALGKRGDEMGPNVSPSKHEIMFEIKILSESSKAAGAMAGRSLVEHVSQARALSLGKSVWRRNHLLQALRIHRIDSSKRWRARQKQAYVI
jgi:hypothetical protein